MTKKEVDIFSFGQHINTASNFSKRIKGILICLLAVLSLASCSKQSEKRLSERTENLPSQLFTSSENLGIVEANQINEASGLVVSRLNENHLWTHNDSGGEPQIYLMDSSGQHIGVYRLTGAQNLDWEDIAIGPGPEPGINYIYVGDIGDNRAVRESLVIYRVAEPDLSNQNEPGASVLNNVDRIQFQFPDGARDCETLMIDPWTKDIILVSKREDKVNVYRLPFPQSVSTMNIAEFEATLPYTSIVGGDISADGTEILLKTYDNVFYWPRTTGQSISEALTEKPTILNYKSEPQGEAIAWSVDASRYFTISEEADNIPAILYGYKRN